MPAHSSTSTPQVFASASTYKLFVAHSMVTAVELGEMTWDSPLNGMTLQQCLTTMIVDSDNECPKAWLMRDNGAGYDKVTQQANATRREEHDIALSGRGARHRPIWR